MTRAVRLARLVDRVLEPVLVVLIAVMVASVLWQVITRYVLADPSSWTEELTRYLLIWLGLLGACLTYRRGQHLAIELLTGARDSPRAHLARTVSLGAVAAFAIAVLLVGGFNLVRLSFALGQRSPALGVPLGWVYLALPIAGVLLLVFVAAAFQERQRDGAVGGAEPDGGAPVRARKETS